MLQPVSVSRSTRPVSPKPRKPALKQANQSSTGPKKRVRFFLPDDTEDLFEAHGGRRGLHAISAGYDRPVTAHRSSSRYGSTTSLDQGQGARSRHSSYKPTTTYQSNYSQHDGSDPQRRVASRSKIVLVPNAVSTRQIVSDRQKRRKLRSPPPPKPESVPIDEQVLSAGSQEQLESFGLDLRSVSIYRAAMKQLEDVSERIKRWEESDDDDEDFADDSSQVPPLPLDRSLTLPPSIQSRSTPSSARPYSSTGRSQRRIEELSEKYVWTSSTKKSNGRYQLGEEVTQSSR
eukprot:scpid32311/ scgid12156/ 